MLLTALFGISTLGTPMEWTGDVKAFSYYTNAECQPQDRLYTIYAARKRFEDGSTVTLVRSVPLNPRSTAHAVHSTEGIIERDAAGAATRIATRSDYIADSRGNSASEFVLDPKKKQLVGWGTLAGVFHSENLVLPDRQAYLLDPVEGFAFGSTASLSFGWTIPAGTYGYTDKRSGVVGLQLSFGRPKKFVYELGGRREVFQRVDIVRTWIGSTIARGQEPAGSLLFREDGSLAAYSPLYGVERLPSSLFWAGTGSGAPPRSAQAPPALSGELANLWEHGNNPAISNTLALNSICGVIVPTSVSATEGAAVLAAIPDRARPERKSDGDSG